MKNDIGKVSFDEARHYLGVFHQMGRLALDSDLNEQNELVLRLLQRLAGDAVHTGSPNEGFRVDTHLLIDRLDSRRGWTAAPAAAALFVDYFDHRVGDGSLALRGATAAHKQLDAPLDLSGLVEVVIAVKKTPAAPLVFEVGDGSTTHALAMSTLAAPPGGWMLLRAVPGAWPAALAVDRITRYSFSGLDPAVEYNVDFIKADLPLRTLLVDPEYAAGASAEPAAAVLAADDDQRLWRRRSLRVTQATLLACTLPAPADASRARALLVGVRRVPAAAALTLRLVDAATPAATVTLAAATVLEQGGWELHRYALPQPGAFDWTRVQRLELAGLDPAATYHLGPVLLEADPALDLVVMGGDGSAAGAGRFHGDGLAAVKESSGTYFTQPDLPAADPAALAPVAEDRHRIDWAYLDLWERPLSFAERPELRDVALGGLDTTTRTQLVAQVRLLAGAEVPLAADADGPAAAYAALQRLGQGVLSTKDKPAAVLDPCADRCEPALDGPYLGEDNRLFRVEIHRAGDIGPAAAATTAWFKWSRENAGTVTPLLADAPAGATSATVEQPELFEIGDLVEIGNDLAELVSGGYEDRTGHRAHRRGELRRITSIDLDMRRIGWEDPAVADPLLAPFHAALPAGREQRLADHAKLVRWDGVAACTAGDIVLADGVVIEFGGQAFAPGDHWLFATRTADRSVERLIEAPPLGIRHAYYKLAAIHRRREAGQPETVFCEDLRPRLAALPALDASRVAYDPGAGVGLPAAPPDWAGVGTVQEAIDALLRADLAGEMRLHNKLLHGMGVICGLQLRCVRGDREQIVIRKGYALDCEGHLLHNRGDRAFRAVAEARSRGLLDAGDSGRVELWIERSAGGFAVRVDRHEAQSFWKQVLEGTLLQDFVDKVIRPLTQFPPTQLRPFPDPALPVADPHKRVITLLNLLWQLINPSTGRYLWLSRAEHDLLARLHDDLQTLLASQGSYCALFDHLTPFPPYPYQQPTGIETIFGALLLHRRLRVDPGGRWAASCGVGPEVQIFDLALGDAVLRSAFPGGSNFDVRDLAFDATGTRLHAVATIEHLGHVDSVFATATLVPPVAPSVVPTLNWGPPHQICDSNFVTLATHPAQPNWLYAVRRGGAGIGGLYRFDPLAMPLVPAPWIACNAVGLLSIDGNGVDAVLAEHGNPAQQDGSFDRLRVIDLGNPAASSTPFAVQGRAALNGVPVEDLALANGVVHVTGMVAGMNALQRFSLVPAAPMPPPLIFGYSGTWRLAPMPTRNLVAVADAGTCQATLYDSSGGPLVARERLPLQIAPLALAATAGARGLLALNLTGTVNAIDIATVRNPPPQSFTAAPPVTLALYRADVLKAFTDLAGVLVQYLKDGFFDRFLVDCPECGRDDKVFLGVIEINNGRVDHICNFSKRHYAKSFRTWGYWLSALPLLPMVKTLLKQLACAKLVP